ncbi:MAG: hypothetical protein D4S01_00725 [Dehalococcoidia bacterium]|nr:MAG: hypothetical protein D4S01_00725 [Dehalococcoidia bacterium]
MTEMKTTTKETKPSAKPSAKEEFVQYKDSIIAKVKALRNIRNIVESALFEKAWTKATKEGRDEAAKLVDECLVGELRTWTKDQNPEPLSNKTRGQLITMAYAKGIFHPKDLDDTELIILLEKR